MGRLPENLGLACKLKRIAGVEIDEQEAAFRIDRDVAKRIEHAVSGIVREQQQRLVRDQDEARFAAAMRHVDPMGPIRGVFRELAHDEQGVGARDDGRLVLGQGISPVDRLFPAHALDFATRGWPAGLDVFGTDSEALGDPDLKTVRVPAAHLAVHTIASATLELEPQGPYVRTVDEGLAQGISIDRPPRHAERARVGRPDETWLTGEGRCPGPADRVDRADDQQGQAREERPMLLRHVIADHPAAQSLHPVLDAEPGLDLLLAPMKG